MEHFEGKISELIESRKLKENQGLFELEVKMYFKHILLSLLIITLSSCSYFNCSHKDEMPCGIECEQAQNLVTKLLKYPDDWICILENESCIDCSYYLEMVSKYKNAYFSNTTTLEGLHDQECEIIGTCYKETIPKLQTIPPITEETKVLTVRVSNCLPEPYDPGMSGGGPLTAYFSFKIFKSGKLQLFHIRTNF